MKFAKLLTLGLCLALQLEAGAQTLSQYQVSQKNNNINFGNVDKNVQSWKYLLNSQEVNFLPELEIDGVTKFLPIEIVKSLGANLIFDAGQKTAYITNNDETFVVKEGSKQIYLNNKLFLISDEPIWRNNTLYVPTSFLIKIGALISENKFKNELNVIKGFNMINDLTTNFDSIESKIVFNLNFLPVYDTEQGTNYYKLTFLGTTAKDADKLKKQLSGFTSDFKKIDFENAKPGIVNITFYLKGNMDIVNTYYLDKPGRLIVQFPKLYKSELKEKITNGLYRSKVAEGNYQGPNRINLLEVNTKKDIILKPVIAKNNNDYTLKEVSRIAKDYNAFAGVNGGYFSAKTRFPLGLVYINNELLSTPIYNRSALLFNKDGSFEVKNVDLNIFLKITDINGATKSIKMNAYNQPPQKNQLVLFTYNYGKNNLNKATKANPPKVTKPAVNEDTSGELTDDTDDVKDVPQEEYSGYIVSNKGTVINKLSNFNQDIPSGSFALYASGKGREDLEKAISNMSTYEIVFDYSESLDKAVHALGGGPTLVKDGSVNVTAQAEKFQPDIAVGRAPRTALAILQNNRILIMTVDGRQDNSKGMTLDELANYLKAHDAKEAINFDGGGSTAMSINGTVVNTISDPQERKVSNGLMIFLKK